VRSATCSTVLRNTTVLCWTVCFCVCGVQMWRSRKKEEMRCLFLRPGCSDRLRVVYEGLNRTKQENMQIWQPAGTVITTLRPSSVDTYYLKKF
jgi:hypothetical protein